MPQRRKDAPAYGAPGMLQAEALEFLRDWPGKPPRFSEADLYYLIRLAVDPFAMLPAGFVAGKWLPAAIDPANFVRLYATAPDFCLAFLVEMRRVYFKPSEPKATKQRRLEVFLANHMTVSTDGNPPLDRVESDKELATAFTQQHGEPVLGKPVTAADVKAARKTLIARYNEGDRLSNNPKVKKLFKVYH